MKEQKSISLICLLSSANNKSFLDCGHLAFGMSETRAFGQSQPAKTDVKTLTSVCQEVIVKILENNLNCGRTISDLCKYVPDYLLQPIFESLLNSGSVSETALLAYLVPDRLQLEMHGAVKIRNSVFKQIGYNCPNMVSCRQHYLELNSLILACCQLELLI